MIENKEIFRDKLIEELRKELLGPGSEGFSEDDQTELIWEAPTKRYSVGMLYPQQVLNSENDEKSHSDNENGLFTENHVTDVTNDNTKGESPSIDINTDEMISLTNQFKPSSMGMTFYLEGNADELIVDVNFGKYEKAKREEIKLCLTESQLKEVKTYVPFDNFIQNGNTIILSSDLDKDKVLMLRECISNIEDRYLKTQLRKLINYKWAYKRKPYVLNELKFRFESGVAFQEHKIDSARLFVKRSFYPQINKTSFTVVLVNDSKLNKETTVLFQPQIGIHSSKNSGKIAEYIANPFMDDYLTEEERNLELLFREKNKYGVGHGVSVIYAVNDNEWLIETCFMPEHEVKSMEFDIEGTDESVLSMESLSTISKTENDEIIKQLNGFVEKYENWITDKEKEIDFLHIRYRDSAAGNIKKSKQVVDRLYAGITLLKDNEDAMKAFRDANLAMLMQRVQGQNKKKNTFPEDGVQTIKSFENVPLDKAKWRAFQLAFFLMALESIANEKSDFRDLVDLIWVPTGGGKTEAYLALTAFTIFYRRLKCLSSSNGTAVIMRYTLRLLAAQQFTRATSLICACELIRKENIHVYGNEEITVGLWIGSKVTPNKMKDAEFHYKKLDEKTNQYNIDEHYKFQLLECPWCGTKLIKEKIGSKWRGKYGLVKSRKGILHKCTNSNCEFFTKLPVSVIDEQIYNKPPTLLFGTVDKFATLPWEGDISRIFASDDEKTASPELIIQDELHLISGPLGTVVGLYETVIDALCSKKGIKPKIIASTATIRNADEQVKNLYNRQVSQFPPPVLDIDNSYFIRTSISDENRGRKYIGIMGAGKTQTTVEIRLMAKLLQAVNEMDAIDSCKDAYWTLVGYFNSIRELGKCTTLVADDIKDSMRRIANRNGTQTRLVYQSDELTSRETSNNILKTLDKLELRYHRDNYKNKEYVSDVVLATNMISVGVDVGRLNSMVVVGQPKLTAEYIQASSRVGRKDPGLVCTLYDSAKTRDRSHYENFKSYHDSFYYYVEPTSLTPFSEAAIERALHALVVSLMRHYSGMNDETCAGMFEIDSMETERVKEMILSRVRDIDEFALPYVEAKLDKFLQDWNEKISSLDEGQKVTYSHQNKEKTNVRLIKDFGKDRSENAYETLRAMRNVDTETKVHLRRLEK